MSEVKKVYLFYQRLLFMFLEWDSADPTGSCMITGLLFAKVLYSLRGILIIVFTVG